MWVKRYMLGDVAVRQLQRRSSSIKAWTIQGLKRNCQENKQLRLRESKFERIHIGYLEKEVFKKLSTYALKSAVKKAKYSRYQNRIYKPSMQTKVFDFLKKYVQTSILKRMKNDLAGKSFRKLKLTKCVGALKKNVRLLQK